MSEKILIVEDNEDFARVLERHLNKEGFEIEHASDGERGLELALTNSYALVILDIGLPKRDGLEVLEEIRKANQVLPVILLTSRSEEIDKVVGLDLGADDYITKPFNVAELLARINARLRGKRAGVSDTSQQKIQYFRFGDFVVDVTSRQVKKGGREVALTTTEFDLLAFFVAHSGQAFSREELLESVWKYEQGDYLHTVNNMIMTLRKKIEPNPTEPIYLKTVRGYGYRFASESEL